MSEHFEMNKEHCVALSMMDLSFWCYECDSYVFSKELTGIEKQLSALKFGTSFVSTLENVQMQMPYMVINEEKIGNIKYHNFIEMFKANKCKLPHIYNISQKYFVYDRSRN